MPDTFFKFMRLTDARLISRPQRPFGADARPYPPRLRKRLPDAQAAEAVNRAGAAE